MDRKKLLAILLAGACAIGMCCSACSSGSAPTASTAPASEVTFASVSDKTQAASAEPVGKGAQTAPEGTEASSDPASEIVGFVVDGPPEGYGTPADQVRSPDDLPPLSSFTEQPGEEGFVSLERMRSQIHELIQGALAQGDYALAGSSNPRDYISDGRNPYYNEIVALGPVAIPDLKREIADSPANGTDVYLFAIAIEEIEGADLTKLVDKESLPWSGKEFLEVWTGVEENAPQRISEILHADDLSFEEKTESLSAYGALAVPFFMKLMSDESIDPDLRAFMTEYVDQWGLTDEEIAALLQ